MSKVESKTGVVVGGVYRHYKSPELGRQYEVLGMVINSTNGDRNGEVMVRYRRVGGEAEFVRFESEFVEPVLFEPVVVRRFTRVW